MTKKKVVFLVGYFPIAPGGAELQSYQIANELKSTHDIYFISIDDSISKMTKKYENGFTVYLLPKNKLSRRLFTHNEFVNYYKVKHILNEIKPDILYQRCACYNTWIACKLKDKYNYKFIYHCASDLEVKPLELRYGIKGLFNRLERFIVRKSLRKADCIYVQNSFQFDKLRSIYPSQNIKIVYNFSYPPQSTCEKSYDHIKVMWVANVKPIKNPECYLQIVRKFAEVRNITFYMIGGEGSPQLMNEIKALMNEQENFMYLGRLHNSEINLMLEEAHLLVNTSLNEGFSNVFVQSWFRGVQVLSLNSDPDNLISHYDLGIIANGDQSRIVDYLKDFINGGDERIDVAIKIMEFAHSTLSNNAVIPRIAQDF